MSLSTVIAFEGVYLSVSQKQNHAQPCATQGVSHLLSSPSRLASSSVLVAMLIDNYKVASPNVTETEEAVTASYNYESTDIEQAKDGSWVVTPTHTQYEFKTHKQLPKLGWVFVLAFWCKCLSLCIAPSSAFRYLKLVNNAGLCLWAGEATTGPH